MNNTRKLKKTFIAICFICSVFYVLLFIRPTLMDFDECYTLSVIHNSYAHIVYITSQDVHPFLYYFLLKLFLTITTFWSKNLLLKIIVARLFSLLLSIGLFIFLRKISFIFHIQHNIYLQWSLFTILPIVLGIVFSSQQLVDIRMYSLAALFVAMEFYYLLRFQYNNKNLYLIIILLAIIGAMYTHYYALMTTGLLLIFYCFYFIRKRNYKNAIKLFITGIIALCAFIPWMPIIYRQIYKSSTYWMSGPVELFQIIHFVIIILSFIYPIIRYYKHTLNHNIAIIMLAILCISTSTIMISLLKSPIFQFRYMYPLLIIYEFLSINICIKYNHIYAVIISQILIFLAIMNCPTQIHVDAQAIHFSYVYSYWQKAPKVVHMTKTNRVNRTSKLADDSLYMYMSHHIFIIPKGTKHDFEISWHKYDILYSNTDKRIKVNNIK